MMARRVPFLRRCTIAPHTDTRNASPAWHLGKRRVQSRLAELLGSAISRLLRVFPGARRASRAQRKTVPRSQTMGSSRADAPWSAARR